MRRLVLAVAIAALITACNSREEPVQPARTPTPTASIQAVVTQVQTVQVPLRVEVTGQVTALVQATLSSQVQSTVEELRVREGTAVKKGQTLVVLDSRDLRAELADLRARGVRIEAFDAPDPKTDADGIADMGFAWAAWILDPSGNALGIIEPKAAPRG